MGSNHDRRHISQRVERVERFIFEHIKGCASNLSLLKCVHQIRRVDNGTSPHVDNVHRRSAKRKELCVKQVIRLRSEGGGNDDVVRPSNTTLDAFDGINSLKIRVNQSAVSTDSSHIHAKG